jgi:hypothetical protein
LEITKEGPKSPEGGSCSHFTGSRKWRPGRNSSSFECRSYWRGPHNVISKAELWPYPVNEVPFVADVSAAVLKVALRAKSLALALSINYILNKHGLNTWETSAPRGAKLSTERNPIVSAKSFCVCMYLLLHFVLVRKKE